MKQRCCNGDLGQVVPKCTATLTYQEGPLSTICCSSEACQVLGGELADIRNAAKQAIVAALVTQSRWLLVLHVTQLQGRVQHSPCLRIDIPVFVWTQLVVDKRICTHAVSRNSGTPSEDIRGRRQRASSRGDCLGEESRTALPNVHL